jgi:hypothetical protein
MKTTHEQLRVLAEAVRPDVVIELLDQLDIQAGGIEAVQATNQRLAELAASKEANRVALEALESTQDFDTLTVGDCLDKVDAAITQLKKVLK